MPTVGPKPFYRSPGGEVQLYQGDVLEVMRKLPAKSVQCVVTSPPYWGLRDYGTGTWEGGDENCDHVERYKEDAAKCSMLGPKRHLGISLPETNAAFKSTARQFAEQCHKCGARRIDQQLGSEAMPDCGRPGGDNCALRDWANGCYVCRMVLVFREVFRVLRDDGICWINLGDSYSGNGGYAGDEANARYAAKLVAEGKPAPLLLSRIALTGSNSESVKGKKINCGLPSGNLVGIPWRVALALQADGWILRQDVIWVKTSCMPESVRNRCTKSHEYVFLLAKRAGYFYDAEAIKDKEGRFDSSGVRGYREGVLDNSTELNVTKGSGDSYSGANKRSVWSIDDEQALLQWMQENAPDKLQECLEASGNRSDVWRISSAGYPGAHYATFPERLVEPMILAGTSARGCCAKCGDPYKRVINPTDETVKRQATARNGQDWYARSWDNSSKRDTGRKSWNKQGGVSVYETIGWQPTCDCDAGTVPCVVLDPFIGSGTTCAVAIKHGRRGIGIDLSERYLTENAIPRIAQALVETGGLPRVAEPLRGKVMD